MSKNRFYQTKKNFFKYVALPTLAIMASCSLSKEFTEDDLYYSPKDNLPRTEITYSDSSKNKEIPLDTLEIKTIQDLDYVVRNGADATSYWENYFMYSAYSSSLGWDADGDGIVNAFDLHPYSPDFFDDLNNNGISDELEFNYFFPTNLDFIYWDLYYPHPPWKYPWNHNHAHISYFNYEKDKFPSFQRRQRTLTTRINNQSNHLSKRNDELNSVRQRQVSTRQRYERPKTQERTNTNYNPRAKRETRNTYTPRTNNRSNTQTRTPSTRSQGSTVRSSPRSSNSSGSSTRSSTSPRNSNSSNPKRSGRR